MSDARSNASGSFHNDDGVVQGDLFATVNTVEQAVYVERLPNPLYLSRGSGNILLYGKDNLYPDKVESMAQRSQSCKTAIRTLGRFLAGQGFKEQGGQDINKIIVNDDGETLFDILDHTSIEKSKFGVPLHFNYNVLGEIIEIQEIPFKTLRWKKDFSRLVFTPDWSKSGRFSKNDKIEFYKFNPETVQEEIAESGGIENYPGQVLYWIPERKEIYPLATFDSVLDDVQFEHESGVYKLRNIQNGFSANYVEITPMALTSGKEQEDKIKDVQKSRGANNAGRTKVLPLNAAFLEAMGSRKIFEEIPRIGVDKLFEKQNSESRSNIYARFQQPPILNGIATNGMFNQESFQDAFHYYNSITEKDRQELERIFNLFMPFTIWGLDNLEIEPLNFQSATAEALMVEGEGGDEVSAERAKAQANLKGTVGGVQGILEIQRSVSEGTTQYDAGLEILVEIYGFEEDKARKILGEPIDLKQTDKTIEE